MTMLGLSNLGYGMGANPSLGGTGATSGVQRAAFEDVLARKSAEGPAAPTPVITEAGPQAVSAPSQAGLENAPAERERVRRSLELDTTRAAGEGDTILQGLQKLRGTFENRHARINEIMNTGAVDTNALLAMQMEVAQYTLLVDVSSKLTGKTTQSLDTLMKGQ